MTADQAAHRAANQTIRVKICGLTTLEDALAAVEVGADMLGFNFYPPSPRFVSVEHCARMVQALRMQGCRATLVGVFVNAPAAEIAATLEACSLDLAQLSGDEPAQTLQVLGGRAFKALRPRDAAALEAGLQTYALHPGAPAYLVDAYRLNEYGGTGQAADWRLAQRLARQAPILLAGGLRPENVAGAIRQVQPWGVDVASGVERAPGVKDRAKMAAFTAAARQVELLEDK